MSLLQLDVSNGLVVGNHGVGLLWSGLPSCRIDLSPRREKMVESYCEGARQLAASC